MKKLIVVLLILLAFLVGRSYGIYHALTDSRVYTYDSTCDQTIYIELDGELWVHG